MKTDVKISNQMQQVARMYQLLESHLRRASREGSSFTIDELKAQGDIVAASKGPWQVRDMLTNMRKKGMVMEVKKGTGEKAKRYRWNMDAPPFMLTPTQRQKLVTEPSEPTVERMSKFVTEIGELHERHMERRKEVRKQVAGVELVVDQLDAVVTLERNPDTDMLRVTIRSN